MISDRVMSSVMNRVCGPPPGERRAHYRFKLGEESVWCGWWPNPGNFKMTAALLLDVSQGGALALIDDEPPLKQSLWIRVGGAVDGECVRATVIAVEPTLLGPCRVRLMFANPCAKRFFDAAVLGLAAGSNR